MVPSGTVTRTWRQAGGGRGRERDCGESERERDERGRKWGRRLAGMSSRDRSESRDAERSGEKGEEEAMKAPAPCTRPGR